MRFMYALGLGSCLFTLSHGAAAVPAAGDAWLLVSIAGIEGDQGSVRVALFEGPAGFPDDPTHAAIVSPRDGEAAWSVRVPRGTYALAVVHDRDGDGELDKNFLGMPRERYGFSNGARGTFGPPSFDDASFVVAESTVRVAVRVR